jgi:hypothetical protein
MSYSPADSTENKIDKSKTYVFENVEVRLTGRIAKKPSTVNNKIILIQYEVTPADEEGITWKKWAKESDLFTISEE